MKKIALSIFLMGLLGTNLLGQTEVDGKVFHLNITGNPSLPLTKVVFFNNEDTSSAEYVTFTDFNGYYRLGVIPAKSYYIVVTHCGRLVRNAVANVPLIEGNYYAINIGIKIETTNKGYKSNSFPVSENNRNTAKSISELLSNILNVKRDETKNSMVGLDGKKVIILKDGNLLKDDQLLKLRIKDVIALDTYDLVNISPPHPFSIAINIITK